VADSGKWDQRSDQELIRLCNHGNATDATRAFEALYKRHKAYVIRVALRFVRDHDTALDVLQETFSYLLRKFPPSGDGLTLTAQMTTFLYPVARNTAITLMRKADRFPAAEGGCKPDDLPENTAPESGDIAEALGDLSDAHREVILLRFVDDMSLQEIASALAIPVGTVKSRLHLAIRQLRESSQIRKLPFP
jgi:RNA polymerase sigma-70 factor (ECF subfamily)